MPSEMMNISTDSYPDEKMEDDSDISTHSTCSDMSIGEDDWNQTICEYLDVSGDTISCGTNSRHTLAKVKYNGPKIKFNFCRNKLRDKSRTKFIDVLNGMESSPRPSTGVQSSLSNTRGFSHDLNGGQPSRP